MPYIPFLVRSLILGLILGFNFRHLHSLLLSEYDRNMEYCRTYGNGKDKVCWRELGVEAHYKTAGKEDKKNNIKRREDEKGI